MHSLTALIRKLERFTPIDKRESRVLFRSLGRPQVMEARSELRFAPESGHRAFLIEEGWAITCRLLSNGTRQVIDVGIAGDILGMRELLLRNNETSGFMVGPGIIHSFSLPAMEGLMLAAPRLANAILWASSRDEALVAERLVDVGRRSALQRVAHFMLELNARLETVGLARNGRFRCPLSQTIIADALGLTPIHVNRTFRELRDGELLVWREGTVVIANSQALAALCGYDPAYLDLSPPSSASRHAS